MRVYLPSLLYTSGEFAAGGAVLVDGDEIRAAGPADEILGAHPSAEREDWSGLALIPGTVNTHNHSFQSLLRGFAADVPFLTWRDRTIYRYAPYLGPEAIYAGALLAFGEMLRYGVTTVTDFFYVHNGGTENDEAVIRAAKDLGIRLEFARAMYDWPGAPEGYRETVDEAVERTRDLARAHRDDPLVSVCPAPHSPHAASPEMIQAGHALARELDTRYHIHVAEEPFEVEEIESEYGCRPVQYLDRLGVVDESMVAIHLVWLAPEEIDVLGRRGASLAYCPSSNMFLADGVTNVPDLLRAGVTIGLGTDGACSNNRVSVFDEMRMVSLLQKVHRLDATALTARQAFAMGTRDGARALGRPVGEISAGKRADFVGLRLDDLSLQPSDVPGDVLLTNIVYAMQPNAVDRVIVGGREVVRGGKLMTIEPEAIVERVKRVTAGWPRP